MVLINLFIFILSSFQLLAGAKVNEVTKHRQTALHLAAQQDLATISSVLLENGVDFAAEDENGNNGTIHYTTLSSGIFFHQKNCTQPVNFPL